MSGDGPKGTSHFFVNPLSHGLTTRPDSETMAGYVGAADPLVMRKRVGEMRAKLGDRDAYGAMKAALAANTPLTGAADWEWREKMRAHCAWQESEWQREAEEAAKEAATKAAEAAKARAEAYCDVDRANLTRGLQRLREEARRRRARSGDSAIPRA